jgi:hypothetical protein
MGDFRVGLGEGGIMTELSLTDESTYKSVAG